MSEPINTQVQASNGLPIICAEWQKNAREIMRVRLDEFQGQRIIDCRAWYTDREGILRAGRGGFTLSVKYLPQLAKALGDALIAAKASGFVEGNKP